MLEIFIDHAITELYFNRNHLMSSKKDFLNFLMENYISNKTDLTFRQLVSTYFRIYGKSNREENYPLQGYRNQSTKEFIKILMSLLNYYKDIEPFHARYDLESDRLKTFK